MLAKILEDMWVDPDVLEALSEEQKRVLFVKMREEQVRRWRVREEEEQRNGLDYCNRANKTVKSKQVNWLLGRDGDVSVIVIGETDEFRGCKLLQNMNNRLPGDNLNGIQTQGPGNEAADPGFKQEEHTHVADDAPSSPLASSEEDMDMKDTDSSDSDSGSGSDALIDWAPPLYRPHSRLLPHGTTHREEGTRGKDREVLSNEKPPSCRGRVAELRKAFASENSTPSPGSKPPIPTKPLHLQRQTAACIH
ncbi:hypothetical protein NQD34_007709 [Periophthalmus magnuspinnatus]|uniref:SH2 domain-containing protein 4A n=1 Tax=Periophthalmus magnuspinnatus TaxID=409849 RepID=UPI00145A231E|nr:SH2 domain-containing protein 4A [Periophthalmus magnuspinnatus]XP_033830579.1 SH2 domain-containing protein 4A [Periophthalmus magnuspinnatus]XP_033830580.1 SH2 domain-containing protein 4A [Periophthalmus magnuspinnatus]XP_055081073.1 SH2 domain-containing protein 4A [Periophthalmus magnuspinnatus]KAJ0002560.1 hypothetical protein NQD34_007709 [Periophthalmus magnuspinnatus]